MKKSLVALVLILGGCVSSGTPTIPGGAPSTGTIAGAAADISTSINLACSSAQQILQLPGTAQGLAAGLSSVASKAATLSTNIGAYCALGQLAGSILSTALTKVNTPAAQLLGTGVATPSGPVVAK